MNRYLKLIVLLQNGGQYFAEEEAHLGVPPLYLELNEYSQYCYDATWTLAYALNETINGNVCVCVCVYVCACACMCDDCMHACVCVCMHVHECVCVHACA